jgi:hypothetical protein
MDAIRRRGLFHRGAPREPRGAACRSAYRPGGTSGRPAPPGGARLRANPTPPPRRSTTGAFRPGAGRHAGRLPAERAPANLEKIRRGVRPGRGGRGGRVIFGGRGEGAGGRVFVSVWADDVLLGGPSPIKGVAARDLAADEFTRCGIRTRFNPGHPGGAVGQGALQRGGSIPSPPPGSPYGKLGEDTSKRRALLEEAIREVSGWLSGRRGSASGQRTVPFPFLRQLLPSTVSHHSLHAPGHRNRRETEIEAITGEVIRGAGARHPDPRQRRALRARESPDGDKTWEAARTEPGSRAIREAARQAVDGPGAAREFRSGRACAIRPGRPPSRSITRRP